MKYVVGIDIGTSACKNILLDENGNVVGTATKEYYAKVGTDGSALQDPLDWYQAFIDTLNELCRTHKVAKKDIVAVSATGQMQGCTFIGADGEAVYDSMLWYDTSPSKESEQLNELYGEIFLNTCNMPSTTALTGSKIRWLIEHHPEIWEKVEKFTFASAYITYKLTGRLSTDTHNLGLSGLNSVKDNGWSVKLMELTQVAMEKAPELTGCFEVVGTISKRAAQETGLSEETTVIAGGGDGATECYSIGIAGKSEFKVRLGSAGDIVAVLPEAAFAGKPLEGMRYIRPEYLAVGNYTKACAISVKWIRDTFYSELPKDSNSYGFMDSTIKASIPGTNGLLYHPYLVGENAPYFDADLKAKFTGINVAHKRGDFLKAAYEGISFSIRDVIESIPTIQKLEQIVVVGGGAKSKIWVQILTNVLGKNATIPKYCDAAYGVALMAGEVAGVFLAQEIITRSREEGERVLFEPDKHEEYSHLFRHYKEKVLL